MPLFLHPWPTTTTLVSFSLSLAVFFFVQGQPTFLFLSSLPPSIILSKLAAAVQVHSAQKNCKNGQAKQSEAEGERLAKQAKYRSSKKWRDCSRSGTAHAEGRSAPPCTVAPSQSPPLTLSRQEHAMYNQRNPLQQPQQQPQPQLQQPQQPLPLQPQPLQQQQPAGVAVGQPQAIPYPLLVGLPGGLGAAAGMTAPQAIPPGVVFLAQPQPSAQIAQMQAHMAAIPQQQIAQYLGAVSTEFESLVRECNTYREQKELLERKCLSCPLTGSPAPPDNGSSDTLLVYCCDMTPRKNSA